VWLQFHAEPIGMAASRGRAPGCPEQQRLSQFHTSIASSGCPGGRGAPAATGVPAAGPAGRGLCLPALGEPCSRGYSRPSPTPPTCPLRK